MGNSYTIELMNLHTDTDSNSNTTSLNENEKAELNDNKLLFSLKDLENIKIQMMFLSKIRLKNYMKTGFMNKLKSLSKKK